MAHDFEMINDFRELIEHDEIRPVLGKLYGEHDDQITWDSKGILKSAYLSATWTPTSKDEEELWIARLKESLSRGLVKLPQPIQLPPLPPLQHIPQENELLLDTGPDGYRIYSGDPFAREHGLLNGIQSLGLPPNLFIDDSAINDAIEQRVSKSIKSILLQADGDQRVRLLLASIRRTTWMNWRWDMLSSAGRTCACRILISCWSPGGSLVRLLLKRPGNFNREQLAELLKHRTTQFALNRSDTDLWKICQMTIHQHGLSDELRELILQWRELIISSRERLGIMPTLQEVTVIIAIGTFLGDDDNFLLRGGEAWADHAIADLGVMDADKKDRWLRLLKHLMCSQNSKPSNKWIEIAMPLVEAIGHGPFQSMAATWLASVNKPRSRTNLTAPRIWANPDLMMNPINATILKGLAWISGIFKCESLIHELGMLALSGLKKIPGRGPRNVQVTNAALWALSQFPDQLVLNEMAILKSRTNHKPTLKTINKIFHGAAERMGVSDDEVQEIIVPTLGLEDVGLRRDMLGDAFVELCITGTSKTAIRWFTKDGKQLKSVPMTVKNLFADTLTKIKVSERDIKRLLPAQRDRIDQLYLTNKSWPYNAWVDRYFNHPLVGTLARRLIWNFQRDDRTTAGTFLHDKIVSHDNQTISWLTDDTRVTLWHPITQPIDDVLSWRNWLERHQVQQPFKQAHREVYLLTDAERTTQVYSNRFAAHVLKQHQFNALCGARGWSNKLRLMVDDQYPPASRELPQWNLRAEFWIEGIGDEYGVDSNETGTYLRLSTDQVRFYPVDSAQLYAHAGGGGYEWSRYRGEDAPEPVPLEQIPPLVFSEIMRDVDLFVGVASVGNDPTWSDGGPQARHRDYWNSYSFGELSATANTRREILQRLIPRLNIAAQCSFSDKFLIVRGSLRTYKIHLGSGNILMEPNDQYLCIVSRQNMTTNTKVMLPFEGDSVLSIILSKAFMLADDKKITDQTITSQIKQ